MKKRRYIYLLTVLLSILLLLPVQAKDAVLRVSDQADLLSGEEEHRLKEKLDKISKKQKLDIIVVTVDRLNGTSVQNYADQIYFENGYGYGKNKDGILLLLSMENRDFSFSTTGDGVTTFTDAKLRQISNAFLPMFKEGKYYDGFLEYANMCEGFLKQTHQKTVSPLWIPGSLLIGFLGTLSVALIKKSALKSVKFNQSAWQYTEEGSLRLTQCEDRFVNKTVTTRKIVTQERDRGGSSTHIDHTGTKRGGMSGKF